MNVLLIGGGSRITDSIIDKLNKANHRIYLLTGHRDKRESYKHVFQRYDFPYDDDSVKDIFESVKPEMVFFLGAFDRNFDWERERRESVRYTTSLMNIFSAYSMVGKGRFVYFSSQEVYSGSYADNIPEVEVVSPRGFKAMAVAQGEEICGNYRRMQNLDILTLRLDHVYGIPRKGQQENDACFRMCLEALKTGKISASNRKTFSMIYLNDAVELAFKAIMDEESKEACYHISSMEQISEMELAQMIAGEMGAGINVIDNSVGEKYRLILDAGKYKENYEDYKIFTHYEEGVRQVVQFVKRHSDSFIRAEDVGGGWGGMVWHTFKNVVRRLVPFLENVICLLIFYWVNDLAAGSEYFEKLDFYLLYVLLFGIVHGQQQAIVSALLAVAAHCYRQMAGNTGLEVLLDYSTYVWTAELFIVGMVVGYMRDQLRTIRDEDAEEIRYLNEKMSAIADINDSNVRMKKNFEAQLVNQRDSLGKIYELTASLEGYGPEEVLFYAAKVLGDLMNSRDVAIYVVANDSYARLFSATSPEARRLGNSINYPAMEGMYEDLKEKRVFINKTMDDRLPLMASAVYAEEEMQLILMLWGIPWQRMTQAEANRLIVTGSLIQNATMRARRYLDALKGERYIEGTEVLCENAFTTLVGAFLKAKDEGLTECTLLEIQTGDRNLEQASKALGGSIRQSDYMGVLEDGRLCVLLSNTNTANARGVRERFESVGYVSSLREEAAV